MEPDLSSEAIRTDGRIFTIIGWDGRLTAQLTNFNFRVTSINRVDEDMKMVYFTATGRID